MTRTRRSPNCRAHRRLVEWMRAIERLAGDLMEQIAQGLDTHKLLQTMRKLLWGIEHEIPGFMDEVMKKNAELRSALSNAPPETIATVEARLRGTEDILDEVVCFHRSLVQYLDRRQLGSKRARAGAAPTSSNPGTGLFHLDRNLVVISVVTGRAENAA